MCAAQGRQPEHGSQSTARAGAAALGMVAAAPERQRESSAEAPFGEISRRRF